MKGGGAGEGGIFRSKLDYSDGKGVAKKCEPLFLLDFFFAFILDVDFLLEGAHDITFMSNTNSVELYQVEAINELGF